MARKRLKREKFFFQLEIFIMHTAHKSVRLRVGTAAPREKRRRASCPLACRQRRRPLFFRSSRLVTRGSSGALRWPDHAAPAVARSRETLSLSASAAHLIISGADYKPPRRRVSLSLFAGGAWRSIRRDSRWRSITLVLICSHCFQAPKQQSQSLC